MSPTSYLEPLTAARRRHPDPRLHALPVADRRDLLRPRRRGHAGVERRGDRQGRLPLLVRDGLERPPGCLSRSTVSSPPASRGVPRDRSPLPRPRARPRRPVPRLGERMKLTVVGCSGSFPGPDSPASCYLVEAPYEGRTFRILLDLGSGALGALQQYVDLETIDAVLLSPPARRPLLRPLRLLRRAQVPTRGALPSLPVYGPEGTASGSAAPTTCRDAGVMTGEFDFRTIPTMPFAVGPFDVAADPGRSPGGGLRPAGRVQMAARWSTPATPARAAAGRPRQGRRSAAGRGIVPRRRRQPTRRCT